jgi:hypothetical protein
VIALFTKFSACAGYPLRMENGSIERAEVVDNGFVQRERRYAVLLRGVIGRAGGRTRMPFTIRNISAHGLRGHCTYPPAAGDPVEVELPGVGSIVAQVRWGQGDAIGLEFDTEIDPTLAFTRNRPGIRTSGLISAH